MVNLDEALSVYYIVFNSYLLMYHVYACFFTYILVIMWKMGGQGGTTIQNSW